MHAVVEEAMRVEAASLLHRGAPAYLPAQDLEWIVTTCVVTRARMGRTSNHTGVQTRTRTSEITGRQKAIKTRTPGRKARAQSRRKKSPAIESGHLHCLRGYVR